MSLSRGVLRLIALLFFLAGVLLLRRPVFGQASTAASTRTLPLKNLSISEQPSSIVDTSGSAGIGHTPSSPDGTYSPRTTYLAM
jgi:hypothetical protein